MGNKQSGQSKVISLPRIIDTIATKYILTQNFQDMKKLENKAYCDNLIILTSRIIGERLNDLEIQYLNQRLQSGEVINKMTSDNVIFLNNTNLKSLDIQNSIKKKRVCIGISKFYIKIAHLFAAIVGTFNPVYSYKNSLGTVEKIPFMKRTLIPSVYKSTVKISKINLCSRRINSIILKQLDNAVTGEKNVQIKSNICSLNNKKIKNSDGTTTTTVKTLNDEPGIPELELLYVDKFDYNTGKFIGMTNESQIQYNKDLALFYTTFTGNKTMPPTIKKFSDVKLKDFGSNPACSNTASLFKQTYTLSLKNSLLKNYANKLKIMTDNANKTKQGLLAILDKLFVYRIDPITKNKEITIHPRLNHNLLQALVDNTRSIIIKLYIGCENDFLTILKTFEAIVENQVSLNTQRKIQNLKQQSQQLMTSSV